MSLVYHLQYIIVPWKSLVVDFNMKHQMNKFIQDELNHGQNKIHYELLVDPLVDPFSDTTSVDSLHDILLELHDKL